MTILAACYLIVAAICALATYFEGSEKSGHWNLMRVFGLALSAVWPAVIVAAIASTPARHA